MIDFEVVLSDSLKLQLKQYNGKHADYASNLQCIDWDGAVVWEHQTLMEVVQFCLSENHKRIVLITKTSSDDTQLSSIIVLRATNGERLDRITREQLSIKEIDAFDLQSIADSYENGQGWMYEQYPLKEVGGVYRYPDWDYVVRASYKHITCRDLSGNLLWSHETTCVIKKTYLYDERRKIHVYAEYHKNRYDEETEDFSLTISKGAIR